MKRTISILFQTVCATVVAVAFWTVMVALNLLHWVVGDAPHVRPLGWAITALSAVGFWILFYRHLRRTVPPESRFD